MWNAIMRNGNEVRENIFDIIDLSYLSNRDMQFSPVKNYYNPCAPNRPELEFL